MKIVPSLDSYTKNSLTSFATMLQRIYRNLATAFNGGIGFGDGTNAENLAGAWVNVVAPGAPNTDFTVSHNLNRLPVGYWVMQKDRACDVYTGSVASTNTQLTLRATVASAVLRLFVVILFLFLLVPRAGAQSTIVSGQITDSAGQSWNNGTYQFQFTPNKRFFDSPYNWTGGPFSLRISGSLSATGSYSQSVPDNTFITPVGSTWTVQFCSGTVPQVCFTDNQTISGPTQTLNETPASPVIPSGSGNSAYSDSEVSSSTGGTYYNVINGTLRLCQVGVNGVCTIWTSPLSVPNTVLPFSTTPSFNASSNISYSMLLTANVTSSTITGTPINGNILSLTLTEDGTGLHTFAFPANFVFTPAFSFNTAANAINELTFKFDGTNWHQIANSGNGVGGGCTPNGNNGDIQLKSGASCNPSSLNDNGSRVNVGNDSHFKGPNPYIDVTLYGGHPFASGATTCTTTASSTAVTIGSALSYANGQGVVCRGAGANFTLSTPAAPTVQTGTAGGPTGTGLMDFNGPVGSNTVGYCVVVRSKGGGYSPCSPTTTITNGLPLGIQTVAVSSWTATNGTITVTTSATHTIGAGTWLCITGDPGLAGCWYAASAPDNTHFTLTTANDTRNGAQAAGSTGGTVTWYNGNHITWTAVTNAWQYYVYNTTSGTLVSPSLIQPVLSGLTTNPLYNEVDDFGSTMMTPPTLPDWVPTAPPVTGKNDDLVTTIVSGGGTTSLVVANAATNAVTNATFKEDNTPNILAATLVALTNQSGVLFFPAVSAATPYVTNSVLDLTQVLANTTLSVEQAGPIQLNDTMVLPGTHWIGSPINPEQQTSFAFAKYPQLFALAAYPGVYSLNQQDIQNLSINGQANSVLWLDELGGNSIPGNYFHNVGFSTSGSNDFMGRHMILRDNANGGSYEIYDHVSMLPGGTSTGSTPVYIHNGGNGSPFVFRDVFLNRRGLYLGAGIQGIMDTIYEQGALMPGVSIAGTTGGTASVNLTVRNWIVDTSAQPIVSYGPSLAGGMRIENSNGPQPGFPIAQGPGGVSLIVQAVGAASSPIGQNTGVEVGPLFGLAIEGLLSTSVTNSYVKNQKSHLAVPPAYKVVATGLAQAAPTCVVSSGGTVPIASYTFQTAPVFADSNGGFSEGTPSATSSVCTTTTGNQTITISWLQVAGAVGYDLYKGGFSFQCNAPWVSGGNTLSYVWSGISACNQSNPQIVAGGPTSLELGGIVAPQIKMPATNGGGILTITQPIATANHTQNAPNADGTYLLDSTVGTYSPPNVNGSIFDVFAATLARPGPSLGSNWTQNETFNGTVNLTASGFGVTSSVNSRSQASWTANTFPNDQWVQAKVTALGGNISGPTVRGSGTSQPSGYACYDSAGGMAIYLINGGSFTSLASNAVVGANGDIVFESVVGNVISCYVTSSAGITTKLTVTDNTLTSGSPGLSISDTSEVYSQFLAGGSTFLGNIYLGGQLIKSVSGNSGILAQSSGTLPNGNVAGFDAFGNIVNIGTPASLGVAWSSLTAPSTSLTLTMTTATSTFNHTSNTNWSWVNTTPATSGVSQSSPVFNFLGTYWTGSASAVDSWACGNVVSNGTNGASTFTCTHSGSLGTASFLVPQLGVGGTPPSCTPGTAGALCFSLGTPPSAASSWSTIYADGTQNAASVNNANTGNAAISRVGPSGCVSVVPVTVSANVATDQNLMACTLNANLLNVTGRTLKIFTSGVYSTAAASTAQITLKYKLCTVSGCGSGTVVTPINIQTVALGGITVTNNPWNVTAYSTTQTAGASSAYEAHGVLSIDLGSLTTAAASIFNDVNTATQSAIDSTGQLFLQITGAFSAASASNSFTQRQLIVEVLN